MMAFIDRANWERLQAQLPPEDREPYPDWANQPPSTESSDTKLTAQAVPGVIPGYGVGTEVANNQIPNTQYPNAGKQTTDGSSTTKVPQELPPGFTAGAFPVELAKWFGEPPANIMGWKINEYTNAAGEKYYKLAISQKDDYGDARWGYSEFGAPIAKDKSGNWILFQGDYSTGSNIGNGPSSTSGSANKNGVYTASDGKTFTDQQAYAAYESNLRNNKLAAETKAAEDKAARKSAYDLLYEQFNQYGLGSLVEGIKGLIQDNVSPSEFAIRLQNTDAYKQRFAANQDRIKQGLRALTPAEYIGLEDQYQNIMRNYGLPSSYYSKDAMGTQAGFNKFISNDVSAAELEDRIATAQKRVINADPTVTDALRQFYPDITNADILAYTLDPTNALENIKRKVTAAEIGGAALGQGLGTSASRAEELAKYGITKAQAQQGYATIGEFLPTATKLGDIYQNQGLGAYNQTTAEKEIFGTAGAAEAAQKRKKLTQLEQAQFGGSSGTAQTALEKGRQGAF